MTQNIFDKILGKVGVTRITQVGDTCLPVRGIWDVEVHRNSGGPMHGTVERRTLENIVTANGLNLIADRLMLDSGSKVNWIAVGSFLTSPGLASSNFGEVVGGRKIGAVATQSREWVYVQATWGGAADGVTSDNLQQAALCNHQTSGSGIVVNIVEGLSTVLADSDFLNLTGRIRIGSHDLANT